jgi:hypothetical protein
MNRLPVSLKKYFWDVDFEKIDFNKSGVYILRRILEYGDERAVAWMWKNFGRDEIKDALCRYRGFSRKSANFWAMMLDIPKDEVLCLREPSAKGRKKIWPY